MIDLQKLKNWSLYTKLQISIYQNGMKRISKLFFAPFISMRTYFAAFHLLKEEFGLQDNLPTFIKMKIKNMPNFMNCTIYPSLQVSCLQENHDPIANAASCDALFSAFFLFVLVVIPIWMYYFHLPLFYALPLTLVVISMVIRRCVKRRQRQNANSNQNQAPQASQAQAPPQPQPEQKNKNQPQITPERLEALSRLVAMGFEVKAANAALDEAGGNDCEAALEILL